MQSNLLPNNNNSFIIKYMRVTFVYYIYHIIYKYIILIYNIYHFIHLYFTFKEWRKTPGLGCLLFAHKTGE